MIGELCKFSTFVGGGGNFDSDDEELILLDPDSVLEENEPDEDEYPTDNQTIIEFVKTKTYKGWSYFIKKNLLTKKLYGEVWKKDNYVVQLVNTSEYDAGGDYVTFAISSDLESLEEFKKDMSLTSETLIDEVLCQTT